MKPKYSVYLGLFDYLAAVIYGVTAICTAHYIVPSEWPMFAAMALAMFVGMLSTFPLLAIFSITLGGFEVLMMSMQIGMLAGMVGVMLTSASVAELSVYGAIAGVLVQFLLHMMNVRLRGEVLQ